MTQMVSLTTSASCFLLAKYSSKKFLVYKAFILHFVSEGYKIGVLIWQSGLVA